MNPGLGLVFVKGLLNDDSFYGTTVRGGANDEGTMFRFSMVL